MANKMLLLTFFPFQIRTDLKPKEKCFRFREYDEGKFNDIFHEHIPNHRINEDSSFAFMKALVMMHSPFGDSEIYGILKVNPALLLHRNTKSEEAIKILNKLALNPRQTVKRTPASMVRFACDTMPTYARLLRRFVSFN